MRNTIKISSEAKSELDWLKASFSFSNFSITIETVVQFFKNNKINPREVLSNNYSEALFELKKEIALNFEKLEAIENNNTERIIKLNRRIEEDYIKPSNRKLMSINEITQELWSQKKVDDFVEKNTPNQTVEKSIGKIEELQKNSALQEKAISDYKDIILKQEGELREYHRCLKVLSENVKFEKAILGDKYLINLKKEEIEKLFYLIA